MTYDTERALVPPIAQGSALYPYTFWFKSVWG